MKEKSISERVKYIRTENNESSRKSPKRISMEDEKKA